MSMREIATIEDRQERYSEITVDAYGYDEQEAAFEVYLQDGLDFPFISIWRDPDEVGHSQKVTVINYGTMDRHRGALLNVKYGKKRRQVPILYLEIADKSDLNAIILRDYQHWFENNHDYYDDFR
ncbi:MAG: calcium-binding protein [Aggregatilineales bacterium]